MRATSSGSSDDMWFFTSMPSERTLSTRTFWSTPRSLASSYTRCFCPAGRASPLLPPATRSPVVCCIIDSLLLHSLVAATVAADLLAEERTRYLARQGARKTAASDRTAGAGRIVVHVRTTPRELLPPVDHRGPVFFHDAHHLA